MLVRILLVGFGSALGGVLRYLVSLSALRWIGPDFPYGTLAVNVSGSFLISLIMQVSLSSTLISTNARLFLTTGIMGGLTTYSTFNYETIGFLRTGAATFGVLNLGLTVAGCLLAGALGLVCGRLILSNLAMTH